MMKRNSSHETLKLYKALQENISPFFPEKVNRTSLFVDIADAYEACQEFIDLINKFNSQKRYTKDQIENLMIEIDVHLLEHLTYHLKSLRREVPRALKALTRPKPRKEQA